MHKSGSIAPALRRGGPCGVGGGDGLEWGAVSGEMKNLCVVLVGTRNPLNVGAVARAMSNFGAMELRAVRPYEKAWRVAKSAVGAGELLARAKEFATLAEAVNFYDQRFGIGFTERQKNDLVNFLSTL